MNVWDITQKALIDAGIDTYPPGVKQGDCKEPYVVLKDDGAMQVLDFSSICRYYTILCYVPRGRYYELLDFVAKCKRVMAKEPIFPMLLPTGTETPSFFDDTFNAYMISVQYRNNVKEQHL